MATAYFRHAGFAADLGLSLVEGLGLEPLATARRKVGNQFLTLSRRGARTAGDRRRGARLVEGIVEDDTSGDRVRSPETA